jgi:hypothetical protein
MIWSRNVSPVKRSSRHLSRSENTVDECEIANALARKTSEVAQEASRLFLSWERLVGYRTDYSI